MREAFQKLTVPEPGKRAFAEEPVKLLQHDPSVRDWTCFNQSCLCSGARSPKLLHRTLEPIREISKKFLNIDWLRHPKSFGMSACEERPSGEYTG